MGRALREFVFWFLVPFLLGYVGMGLLNLAGGRPF